ncbi:NAD(P)H-dependent oxidoreductase [Companilactobacillus mindensis]|uniref:NAD(P)H-dependent oxidoreductase n=1 Tax=Companilactobacillus mindensis TaxID=167481 RepID=UPI000710CFF6|nr:NAD(P)H-dependent oxidoreductase [Companilactobacillus mindensis]GEO79449.1 NAD(P)H dehydrogenase [Companilactobacillus mindensis]
MITIVYAHPWDGSFNHAVLEETIKTLKQNGQEYTLIDLNKDGFNPVLTESELSVYGKSGYKDPLVDKYIKILKATDKIVFVFPIWWIGAPAILKGFFDKVFLKDKIISFENPSMTKVKKALLLTTSELTTDALVNEFTDPIRVLNYPIKSMGAKEILWHNFGNIILSEEPERVDYLNNVSGFVEELL